MKQTKYLCDRCKKDIGVDGNILYPPRIKIEFVGESPSREIELCFECCESFKSFYNVWLNKGCN